MPPGIRSRRSATRTGVTILRLLGEGDKPVSQIAAALPISRPAVSRHLRLLKEAGLVAEQARGTRRIYHLRDEGLRAVQEYLEQVWGDAAPRFRLMAENTPGNTPGSTRTPDDRSAAYVLRRGLLRRARVHRLDRRHRHLVAARSHDDRARRRRLSCRAASAAGSTSGPPTGPSTTGAR